jgi:hypothetical protein
MLRPRDAVVGSPLVTVAQAGALTYAVEVDSQISMQDQKVGSLRLSAKWRVERTHDGPRTLALATFSDVALSSSGGAESEELLRAMRKKLTEPLAFGVDAHGAVVLVRESSEIPPDVAHLAKSVPAYVQFVRPDSQAASWTQREQDGTGTYEAAYEQVDARTFHKRKLKYTELTGSTNPALNQAARLEVVGSSYEYEFNDEGTLTSLRVEETLQADGQYVAGLTTTTRLKLVLLDQGRRGPEVKLPRGLLVSSLQRSPGDTRSTLSIDLDKIGGRTIDEILEVFDKLPPYGERSKEENHASRVAYRALATKLRLYDEDVDDIVDKILDGSPHARTLWSALGTAGTPKAQAALRELIDTEGYSFEDRRSQMIALSLVDRPTRDTVEFLHDKFGDEEIGQQARLGIGTAVNRLREIAPEEADRAFAVLESELTRETDLERQLDLLRGIGNSGHPRAAEVVPAYLQDEKHQVRVAALQAIRLLDNPTVDPTLAQFLADDPDTSVRLSAIDAMTDRPPSETNLTALAEAAERDDDSHVRQQAKQALEAFSSQYEEVAKALAQYYAEKQKAQGS